MAQDRFGGRHRRGNPVGCVELHVRHTHRHAFNRGCYRNFHLVIDPLIHTDMVKKTKQNGSAAMQVLRGGQDLRVYGRGVHQWQFHLIQKVVPRVEQENEKRRTAVVGKQRIWGRYLDLFSFASPMAIRQDNIAYDHISYSPIYPKFKVTVTWFSRFPLADNSRDTPWHVSHTCEEPARINGDTRQSVSAILQTATFLLHCFVNPS